MPTLAEIFGDSENEMTDGQSRGQKQAKLAELLKNQPQSKIGKQQLAELLRLGADKLVNLPLDLQRFITNPQAFTQLVSGKNPLPRETGFAAGATGLPAQEMSVLDPNQALYMQGYSQGEPIAYLGMAAPFAAPATTATAKALVPKLGQVTENYMVRQGMIQPLTAYHGTPHTIRGQFDINKVGTGEGAQTYGHGMYFAENPAVARNYMEFEGLPSLESKVPLQKQTRDFLNEYVDPNSKPSDWLKGAREDAKANNRLDILAELNKLKSKDIGHTTIGGNLYKVDIPDADIPLMLDWDKPLSKDAPQQLKDALNGIIKEYPDLKEPFMKAFRENKPGNHYYSLLNDYAKTGDLVKNQQFASSVLQKAGIPGIRYLDEGSRKTGKGTSNFVVFDPAQVKILEKNSTPYDPLEAFIKSSSK
jgi:hypothetical protein